FATLRRFFRGQIRQSGQLAQWNFTHLQMRESAKALMTRRHISQPKLHATISDHLLSAPLNDPLRLSETMIHLLGSEDWTRAAAHYADSHLTEAELQGATRGMVDFVTVPAEGQPEEAAIIVCRLLDAPVRCEIES